MSYLSDWAAARGMDREACFRAAGIDEATFSWLWAGSRTIPPIALTAAKNLGMDEDGARALGKTLTAERWRGHQGDADKARWCKESWPKRLASWNPRPTMRRIGISTETRAVAAAALYRTKPCASCGEQFAIDIRRGDFNRKYCNVCADKMRESYWRKPKKCELCGMEFAPTTHSQRYCSRDCRRRADDLDFLAREGLTLPKRVLTERPCRVCGQTFMMRAYNQVICSNACRIAVRHADAEKRRHTITCPTCGREVSTTTLTQIYCSRRCKEAGQLLARQQAAGQHEPLAERAYAVCGKMFTPVSTRNITCSDVCRQERERQKMREYSQAHRGQAARLRGEGKQRMCAMCDQLFTPQHNASKYCSDACRDRMQSLQKAEHYRRKKAVLRGGY